MKFGMPTLIEKRSIQENVQLAQQLDLNFVELNLDLPYCSLIPSNFPSKLTDNITFSVHLPENWDVGSLDEDYRQFILSQIEKNIKAGLTIANIRKYTLHLNLGVYFTLPTQKKYIYEEYLQAYSQAFNNSCHFLNELSQKYGVMILFENLKLPKYLLHSVTTISQYPYLFFTLDVGHDEKSQSNAYTLFSSHDKIKHIHLHDYDGKSDHLPLGDGNVDIKGKLLYAKQKDVDIVIEVKRETELRKSISYLASLH